MSVNCLTATEKLVIVDAYKSKSHNQKELANLYNTSARTINRILIEAGVATPVERIKGDAYTVMQLLKEYGVDIPTLKQLLSVHEIKQDYATANPLPVRVAAAPWYPDDSGLWVEVPDTQMTAPKLVKGTKVAILLIEERSAHDYLNAPGDIVNWRWDMQPLEEGRIVAYKVVK